MYGFLCNDCCMVGTTITQVVLKCLVGIEVCGCYVVSAGTPLTVPVVDGIDVGSPEQVGFYVYGCQLLYIGDGCE